ncbi:MAG: hypothetical protein EBY12_04140 [Actinobacteria bacterium]|nr:hypothetical protein [Actinomycetota bacterium]
MRKIRRNPHRPQIAIFNKLYGGGVCITGVDQLAAALSSDQFKAKSEYEKELLRVKQFGQIVKKYIDQ